MDFILGEDGGERERGESTGSDKIKRGKNNNNTETLIQNKII